MRGPPPAARARRAPRPTAARRGPPGMPRDPCRVAGERWPRWTRAGSWTCAPWSATGSPRTGAGRGALSTSADGPGLVVDVFPRHRVLGPGGLEAQAGVREHLVLVEEQPGAIGTRVRVDEVDDDQDQLGVLGAREPVAVGAAPAELDDVVRSAEQLDHLARGRGTRVKRPERGRVERHVLRGTRHHTGADQYQERHEQEASHLVDG